MSTKIVGVLLAIVAIAGGVYYITNSDSLTAGLMGDRAQMPAGPMSLKELIAGGVSQKCTFSDASADMPTEGTVYVGGGKVRGDFSATSQGKVMGMHMIADGATMHTWIDGMTSGFSMSMDATQSGTNTQQSFDSDKKIDYRCEQWATDDSRFVLPSNVTFQDMAAMMQGAMQGAGAGTVPQMQATAAQCQACDQLPGAQKSACRAALKCQ
ncbi:hypothetical protein HYT05_00630 [Candidatus Kaiserbacteria bacterium]|nr:hypothetical protein [Candidatus Kaiserbacteria bacterium]